DRVTYRACHLCEALCGLEIRTEGERIVSIKGDRQDPFSRGHVCPKAAAIPDVMEDPDRLREPVRREGERWVPLSWRAALEEAGERLAGIQRRHGPDAVALYLGNPTVHGFGTSTAAVLFSRALGSRSRFSATSVDQLPHMLASLEVLGHQLLLPVPDLDRTSFLLVLGANPRASNGSLMTAGNVGARLDALRARGGRLVVVDPRRTETAARADLHLAIRPGGDAALLLGLLHVLFAERLARPGRLASFTDGLDRLEALAGRFPPERVAERSGIAAGAIRALARDVAGAETAAAYGRVGICTQEFGGLASWLVLALNVVTGNLDRPGGAMFPSPAVDLVPQGSPGSFGRRRTRVRGLPVFGGELPSAALADEIETPGQGRIRGLVTFAGNPVLSTPNGGRLDRALAGLEYMVSIDLFRNETTRHAHLILPTSFGFERDQYDAVFYQLAVRNVARFAPALVRPPAGVRDDFEVLLDLALALRARGGGRPGWRTGLGLRAARALGARRLLDLALRRGPRGLSLAALRRAPHGIDLGALVPRLPERLYTPGRRIRLVPERYQADLARLEAALDAPPSEGLELIGRRQLRGNNSWMHNSRRLVKGPPACTLLLHPADAAARGLADGDEALVRSRVGEVRVPVSLSDAVAPGVVCLPHGWGHARPGAALAVASARPGASFNDLADEQRTDVLSGTAVLNGIPVTVERAA
ncbi:MAG TPA: molybdopterin-dependent oxidoreductase, partial [Anaeromyxobacteraceae bacterium]|nr:molybdopterin-dependent oxidoreductase [Anaeromyxobacteraceae bacterium]